MVDSLVCYKGIEGKSNTKQYDVSILDNMEVLMGDNQGMSSRIATLSYGISNQPHIGFLMKMARWSRYNPTLISCQYSFARYLLICECVNAMSDDTDTPAPSAVENQTTFWRIAQLKEVECQLAVEDALYMIVLYNFSQIRVPLVPSLSKCLYNGRLEILPSKDYELESIHSHEVLEMVKEHLGVALGWKAGSSVTVNWSTTKIRRQHLSQVYAASILYGYFLKSAFVRLCLEHNLPATFQNLPFGRWTSPPKHVSSGFENAVLGHMVTTRSTTVSQVSRSSVKKEASLKGYVMGFDMETTEKCAKPRSKEAFDLVEKHCSALFGNDDENNEIISTSLSSLKRLVLEAVAFGCFLWDAEECVSSVYKLHD